VTEAPGGSVTLTIPELAQVALVHECVFGVLALESEPVDPRL